MWKKILAIILLIIISFPLRALPCEALSFNPNNLLSNFELTDHQAISLAAIQRFLEKKGSKLANLTLQAKKASEIIWEKAVSYQISPKFLLALLQKEQSLIEDPNPSQDQIDWATGAGVCDSCSKDDPILIQTYKGFAKQVEWATKKYRQYLQDLDTKSSTISGWQVGKTKEVRDKIWQDGQVVGEKTYSITPLNKATACLYTYTPHFSGNQSFWKIWNRYFTKLYLDGSLLREEGQVGVWLIQNGLRRPFLTKSSLLTSYDPVKIIEVSQSEIERYEIGQPIKFANYSLLRSPQGTVYLLVDGKRRGISSAEVFRTLGFNKEEVIDVQEEELKDYPEIEPITLTSAYPRGALLQDKTNGAVFWVENGVKRGVVDRSILKINYKNRPITSVSPEELARYQDESPVKLRDGELVKSPLLASVYVISQGTKRPITSGEVFKSLGYKWGNVMSVPEKVLEMHPTGQMVDVGNTEELTGIATR